MQLADTGLDAPAAHALTIDLEDWRQLAWLRFTGDLGEPSTTLSSCTHRILDMLDEFRLRATFFVVGCLAEARPDLVREVARRGHEIGAHSYLHKRLPEMTPQAFRADLERVKGTLEAIVGVAVRGFRAPAFSIESIDSWAFEVLAETGFRYDSSVFPASFASYGIPDAPRQPFVVETRSGPVREFPLATWRVANRNLPVAGGGYFRLLPGWLLRRALASIERDGGTAVLYFHPYEFEERRLSLRGMQPSPVFSPAYWKILSWYNFNTRAIGKRVARVLEGHRFLPLNELDRLLPRTPTTGRA